MGKINVKHCGECKLEDSGGDCQHPNSPGYVGDYSESNTLHPLCPLREEPLTVTMRFITALLMVLSLAIAGCDAPPTSPAGRFETWLSGGGKCKQGFETTMEYCKDFCSDGQWARLT